MEVLARLEHEAETAERRAAALRKLIEVTRELGDEGVAEVLALIQPTNGNGNGHTSSEERPPVLMHVAVVPDEEKVPRGRVAVMRVVSERPGLWAIRDIRDELKRRGWFTSIKATEVAVTRLCDTGYGRRAAQGLYEFPASAAEAGDLP